jgi:hypothetical protein
MVYQQHADRIGSPRFGELVLQLAPIGVEVQSLGRIFWVNRRRSSDLRRCDRRAAASTTFSKAGSSLRSMMP